MVKKKNVVIFLVLSIFLVLFLAFLPYEFLKLDDNIVLTESEFNKLLRNSNVVIDDNVVNCISDEEQNKLREYSIKY